jgi:hypothetical protein
MHFRKKGSPLPLAACDLRRFNGWQAEVLRKKKKAFA